MLHQPIYACFIHGPRHFPLFCCAETVTGEPHWCIESRFFKAVIFRRRLDRPKFAMLTQIMCGRGLSTRPLCGDHAATPLEQQPHEAAVAQRAAVISEGKVKAGVRKSKLRRRESPVSTEAKIVRQVRIFCLCRLSSH